MAGRRRQEKRDIPVPVDHLLRCVAPGGGEIPAVVFDGGCARFWTRKGLAETVAGFLRREWGPYVRDACVVGTAGHPWPGGTWAQNPNWGDVVVVARPDVALCRREWLNVDPAQQKLRRLVVADHGTWDAADVLVPWWGASGSHQNLLRDALAFLTGRPV